MKRLLEYVHSRLLCNGCSSFPFGCLSCIWFFLLFDRFRPTKLNRSLSQSASDFKDFVRRLCKRSRPQYPRFSTCLCETSVRGHYGLKLFCYPQKLQHDVNQQISKCIVPYRGEGISLKPICEEEYILVSFSEEIVPQGSDEEKALQFVRYNHRIYFLPHQVHRI